MPRTDDATENRRGRRWHAPAVRYGIAALATAAALALTFTAPAMQGRPYILSAVAVIVSAWAGGTGPALAAMVMALVGANVLMAVLGIWSLGILQLLQALFFIVSGIAIVAFSKARMAADREAGRQSDRYRALVEASMAIVWTADERGLFHPPQESWTAVTGQAPAAFSGRGWLAAIHPDDRERIAHLWQESLARELTVDTELRLWNAAAASHHWYSARAVPRRDGRGRIVEWVGACIDIHERRQAEEQLRETGRALQRADREKDDFLALLAHELRNPLAPIRTAVDLLRRRSQEPDTQRLHAVIERQVRHLVRMVDDLLDVSRVLRGKVDLRVEPVELDTLVAIALETSQPLIDHEQQQLTVELPDHPVVVIGDQVRLAQVIANLLNNASKYTDRGGAIRLTVEAAGEQCRLRVSDTGAGIASDLLPRIFEPFVQGDRTLERTRGGLGIGLTLVRQIVHLHGGRVTATSGGAGQGSQFEVVLPLAERATSPLPLSSSEPAASAPPPPVRLLIVDDNADAADTLGQLLAAGGHTVRTAHNASSALRVAESWAPDIAILDIGLPEMSGYELAPLLRARVGPRLGLIAVTGYGEPAHVQQANDAGFDRHLVKPVDIAELTSAIAACADRRTDAEAAR